MKLGIVSLISPISDPEHINATLNSYSELLQQKYTVVEIDPQDKHPDCDLTAVFVKSGGTEQKFKDMYEFLDQPILLISTPLHNSLAASMEILSWLQSNGGNGRILHGTPSHIVEDLHDWFRVIDTRKRLAEGVLGIVGTPSDWLIDSEVDLLAVEKNWGLKLSSIKLDPVIEIINEIADEEGKEAAKSMALCSNDGGITQNEIAKASKVYLALKKLVKEKSLSGITLRCFDLLDTVQTTGCLALSRLNDEGIIAGCEGDVPSAFTMMLAYYLTGKYPFMANLSTIDSRKKELLFAHCTVPTAGLDSFSLDTHFETGIGVGIKGEFPKEQVTVVKIGGKNLTDYVIRTGEIIENKNSPHACRTQILVRLEGDCSYFLNNPIANHHIIIPGDHQKQFEKLFSTFAVQLFKR